MAGCPECGIEYDSDAALLRHRQEAHGVDVSADAIALLNEREEADLAAEEWEAYEGTDYEYETDERRGVGGWLAFLWDGVKVLAGIGFVVAIVLGVLGVFDKESIDESPSDPGYGFVRELQEDGVIDEFRAVEPEEGWDWEYELDGTSLIFRLREEGRNIESEIEYDTSYEQEADTITDKWEAYEPG